MFKKLLVVLFSLSLISCGDSNSNLILDNNKTKTFIKGKTMGTTYHIVVVHPKKQSLDEKLLQTNIDSLLETLNHQVSTYILDSQIVKFNQSKKLSWRKIDNDFLSIVEAAKIVSESTKGALDITISPLVDLWGFGLKQQKAVPKTDQIKKVMPYIGYQLLEINPENTSLRKTHPNLRIDLSSIAKGFAVDKLSDFLNKQGLINHLVEIGGELKASGLNQSEKKWRIAIEQPDQSNTTAQHGIEIGNRALATSGDYRNYFVEKGVRRSHIIDPHTGYPIKHNLASVTVLHNSAMLADAYATALLVMGDKKGKLFAKEKNLDVFMIIRKEDKFEFWSSSDLFL